MAQLSVANYFSNKKRPIVEDVKLNNARKVLILDEDNLKPGVPTFLESQIGCQDDKIKRVQSSIPTKKTTRKVITPKSNKKKLAANQGNIRQLLNSMCKKQCEAVGKSDDVLLAAEKKVDIECSDNIPDKTIEATTQSTHSVDSMPAMIVKPQSSTVLSTDEINVRKTNFKRSEPTLTEIKQKLSRSSRLAEIRASLARFEQSEQKLKVAKQNTLQTKDALTLKNFKTLELEVNLSPQKLKSPEKLYLSPKKDLQGARKNLFGLPSPVKEIPCTVIKQGLTLPYKYRSLAEIFRSIDTVCQILYNRKETITFQKLKPAVGEMLKRNLTEKHLAQIIHLYPDSFLLHREKIREFGTGTRNERWELVIVPQVQQGEQLTPDILLARRRKLFNILIEKLKDYHQEFLSTLDPPMEIERTKITRWHPLFDIEKVPDIEVGQLPAEPNEEKLTTGHEVLEKAREMFNCNTRMERALERLKDSSQTISIPEPPSDFSILKGIPKALLEKVRQKQAAKALETMTRSADKDKEVQLYLKLPEIARLTRSIFVAEKKSVLLLDSVLDKLSNSYRAFSKRNDIETYLRTIAKEINGWIVFHEIRGEVYVKLSKNSDLSIILDKLQRLAELKDS